MQENQDAERENDPSAPVRGGSGGAAPDAPGTGTNPVASERDADGSTPEETPHHGSTAAVPTERVHRGPGGPRPLSPDSSARTAPRHHRLGSLLRPRNVFLPEVRVDPVDGQDPVVEASTWLTVRSPVSTGFLLATGVLLALVLVTFLQANDQLLMWITAALFISLGLDPIVRRLEHWGAPRWVGVTVCALGLAAVAAAFISLLVPTVVEQSGQLVQDLPATVEDVMATSWFQALDEQLQIQHAVRDYVEGFTADGASVTQVFGGLVGIGQTVMNAFFSTLVIVVLTLYFLASLPHMKYWMYRLAPRSRRRRVEALGEEITSSVGHYVMGQSFVALLNGTVAFIAMSIAGTSFPVLLAFVAGVLAFVPLVGAVIGGAVLTAISLLTSWQCAALFAGVYFVYLQIEAYVVSPRVMARAVAVPAAVGVIAVIAGGTMLGVLGALMAIPTAAAVLLLVREVFIPRQDAR